MSWFSPGMCNKNWPSQLLPQFLSNLRNSISWGTWGLMTLLSYPWLKDKRKKIKLTKVHGPKFSRIWQNGKDASWKRKVVPETRVTFEALWKPCSSWLWCPLQKNFSSSVDVWINKLWSIHTMEYYSAIKRKYPYLYTTWMSLRNIMLSERSQAKRPHSVLIPFIWNTQERWIDRDTGEIKGPKEQGKGGTWSDQLISRGCFSQVMEKFRKERDLVAVRHERTECRWVAHIKTNS